MVEIGTLYTPKENRKFAGLMREETDKSSRYIAKEAFKKSSPLHHGNSN